MMSHCGGGVTKRNLKYPMDASDGYNTNSHNWSMEQMWLPSLYWQHIHLYDPPYCLLHHNTGNVSSLELKTVFVRCSVCCLPVPPLLVYYFGVCYQIIRQIPQIFYFRKLWFCLRQLRTLKRGYSASVWFELGDSSVYIFWIACTLIPNITQLTSSA